MTWRHTRSKIAHAKKADPDADVSELQALLRFQRAEENILCWVEDGTLTPEHLVKMGQELLKYAAWDLEDA